MGRQRRSLRETSGQIDEFDAGSSQASAEVITVTDKEQIHLLQVSWMSFLYWFQTKFYFNQFQLTRSRSLFTPGKTY